MEFKLGLPTVGSVAEHRENVIRIMAALGGLCRNREHCVRKYDEMAGFIQDQSAVVIGALHGQTLFGYAWCYGRGVGGERCMYVTQIAVVENYRSCGIGGRMIDKIKKYAQNRNIQILKLNVRRENYAAQAFYRQHEFNCESHLLTLPFAGKRNSGGYCYALS